MIMCQICDLSENTLSSYQAYRYDPTKTTTLRNAFARQMRVRFSAMEREIVEVVGQRNELGIEVNAASPRFNFPTDQRKVEEFMNWIDELIARHILSVSRMPGTGSAAQSQWTDLYVQDSYKRGLIRARTELRKLDPSIPSIEQSGGVEAVMGGTPFHMERVGLLYVRAFQGLKGITDQMATQISRVLSQAMIDGDHPSVAARKLVRTISGPVGDLGITDSLGRFIPAKRRAEMLARTEIIRAHHKGMMREYRNWRTEGLYVEAELRTAGDHRVCDVCLGYQGQRFSLDEAEGLIPVHPMCRCVVVPYET